MVTTAGREAASRGRRLPVTGLTRSPAPPHLDNSPVASAAQILQLQTVAGNRAVSWLLQRQPTLAPPAPAPSAPSGATPAPTTAPALPPPFPAWTAKLRQHGILTADDAALAILPTVSPAIAEHAAAPPGRKGAAARKEAATKLRTALHDVIGEQALKLTDDLPQAVRDEIDGSGSGGGGKVERRTAFLLNVAPYTPGGTVAELRAHFMDVVPVDIPGFKGRHHHMHRPARDRFKLVAEKMASFQMKTPIFGNALALRGRHLDPSPQSVGMMSHLTGLAMDFQAVKMPHIYRNAKGGPHGPYIAELRDLVTGGATGGQFSYTRMKGRQRDAIIQLGKAMAGEIPMTPELRTKAGELIRDYDENYDRVTKGSNRFRDSGIGAKLAPFGDRIRAAIAKRAKVTGSIARLEKKVAQLGKARTPSKKQLEQLAASQTALRAAQGELKEVGADIDAIKTEADLKTTFKPWLDEIDKVLPGARDAEAKLNAEIAKLVEAVAAARKARIAAVEGLNAGAKKGETFRTGDLTARQIPGEQAKAKRLKRALERQLGKAGEDQRGALEDRIAKLDALLVALDHEAKAVGAEGKSGKALRDKAHLAKWKVKRLEGLTQRLLNDEVFIWGTQKQRKGKGWSEVRNPSMQQLHEVGYFTPQTGGPADLGTEDFIAATVGGAPAPAATQAATPKPKGSSSEGFNQTFMRLMTLHGFEQLVGWDGAQDSMHFDFQEGLAKFHTPSEAAPSVR